MKKQKVTLYRIETKFEQSINSSSQIVKAKMRNVLGFLSDWLIDGVAFIIVMAGKLIFGLVDVAKRNYNRHYPKGKHLAD